LAVEPFRGRAAQVEGTAAPQADLTSALYEEYGAQIFRYCLHQLGSREEAEDAVQSTFLNAFRGIKRGIVPELESAWLFKIAQNVCLSRRRSSWRRDRIESPADFGLVAEVTPAPSRRAEELIGLQDVLERMPESQRRAILLREWQGLSYHEIADELELSQAAVETLIFRARRSLAQGLEQPEPKKRRSIRGVDLGSALAGVKSLLLGGGAAVKVAATIAVVSATTVVAASPIASHHAARRVQPAAPKVAKTRSVPTVAALVPATAPAAVSRRTAVHATVAPPSIRPDATFHAADPVTTTAAPVDPPTQQAAAPPARPTPAPPQATAPAASSPVTPPAATQTPAPKDDSSSAPVVAPQQQTSSGGNSAGAGTPADGQMPTVVPTPVTLSSPPAGSSGSSPTPAPAGSTPDSGSSGSSATVVPPVSVLPASPPSKLSVQPPSVTGVHSSSNP
jgi:RNA polymerase sigma factor (sigma-70 family)